MLALSLLALGSYDCARTAAAMRVADPVDYVNVLSGTAAGQADGRHTSSGNTLPLVARPWGFNHWAPQTTDDRSSWWFDSSSDSFRGIRCTHQPSPWIGDWCWFVLRIAQGWSSSDEFLGFTSFQTPGVLRPYVFDIMVGPHGVHIEFVPTVHGSMLRVEFPDSLPPEKRRICAWVPIGPTSNDDEKVGWRTNQPTGQCIAKTGQIDLQSRKFSGGQPDNLDYALYARLEASGIKTVEESDNDPNWCIKDDTRYVGPNGEPNIPGESHINVTDVGGCQDLCLNLTACAYWTYWSDGTCSLHDINATVQRDQGSQAGPKDCLARQCCFLFGNHTHAEVSVGTSFISPAQASRALASEVTGRSFEELVADGRKAWQDALLHVEVADAGPPVPATWQRLEIFYTSLYRVLLFPRRLDENTPEGVFHRSPYKGHIQAGPGVTDNGFWDTFRTVYQLLSLAYPVQLGEIIAGWLNAYEAGGWLPKWASPGYRDCMVGTFADVVLADAILKNISGFDHALAWQALLKDSFENSSDPKDTARGKYGLRHYMKEGYIAIDVNITEACSRTLDFAYADTATAAAARRLGHIGDAEVLSARAWRALNNTYDRNLKLMGRRFADGTFDTKSADEWGNCYTEGSAWQHSFPPFNISALIDLYGGRDNLTLRLHELLTTPSTFQVGSYGKEIHEMREMRMLSLGQYAHNNQPAHHLPYLFSMLGDHNATALLVRQILARAYSHFGFAGDEDNGEMGAWYVLSALGLYAAAVGTTEDYVLGAVPLFPRVLLPALDVAIEAPAASEAAPAIARVLWRSRSLERPAVTYSALRIGGVLRFESPGDHRLGHIFSNLRGVIHQVAKSKHGPGALVPRRADGEQGYSVVAWAYLFLLALVCAIFCRRCCRLPRAFGRDHAE